MPRRRHQRKRPAQRRGALSPIPPELTAVPTNVFVRVVCPLCGFNRAHKSKKRLAKGKPEELTWNPRDPADGPFAQLRMQHKCEKGWVCKGFTKVPGGEFDIVKALHDPVTHDVAVAAIHRVFYLARRFEELGLADESDVPPRVRALKQTKKSAV